MQLIVDLHVHSHYSRATSNDMNLEGMYKWGKIKGINIIGTGDFTHPLWLKEMQEKLEPAEFGLYKLKDEITERIEKELPSSVKDNLLRFVLTVEISSIYKKNDRVRKVHNIVVVPDFKTAAEINNRLSKIGNLKADGRPILGLDSKELLKIVMECGKDNLFVPAHIWTPWFSMFGSKSGFDSINETFDELAGEIRAIETGLSSDPYMNWRLNQLEKITLISNSDAHSPQKLGREANVVNSKVDYREIIGAIKTNDKRFVGTIEFYPEEGKYHVDGHSKCKFFCNAEETKRLKGICPKCGKPLVVGVDYRVNEIADKPIDYKPKDHKQVEYIIPLAEMIAEAKAMKSTSSKAVQEEYFKMINKLGDEFSVLRKVKIRKIKEAGFEKMAEGIEKMRDGKVIKKPGYDGVYGVIKVFGNSVSGQTPTQVNMGL